MKELLGAFWRMILRRDFRAVPAGRIDCFRARCHFNLPYGETQEEEGGKVQEDARWAAS